MRKILQILLVIGFLQVPIQSNGQAALLVLIFGEQAATENFHFSLDFGGNFTTVGTLGGNPRFGWHFGLGNHIKINDKSKLIIEFKPLNHRGERKINAFEPLPPEIDSVYSSSEYQLNYNSLDIPVIYTYYLSDRWQLSAGATISYLTSANQTVKGELTRGGEFDIDVNMLPLMQRFQGAVLLDLCYHIEEIIPNKQLDIRFRVNQGITPLFNDQTSLTGRETYFQLILSLPFLKNEN
ncbi:MAG: hypothetical protein SchgKO_03540 [Schleiferiaceae bacterium]